MLRDVSPVLRADIANAPKGEKMSKVERISDNQLIFDDGLKLCSQHIADCCESHYLSFENLTVKDFEGLEFDLTSDTFFERVKNYGIRLIPLNGYPISVPGYGYNNGYYSSNLQLLITDAEENIIKEFDVTECQEWIQE